MLGPCTTCSSLCDLHRPSLVQPVESELIQTSLADGELPTLPSIRPAGRDRHFERLIGIGILVRSVGADRQRRSEGVILVGDVLGLKTELVRFTDGDLSRCLDAVDDHVLRREWLAQLEGPSSGIRDYVRIVVLGDDLERVLSPPQPLVSTPTVCS